MERFAHMLLGPPRAEPRDIFIHSDGEPELLKPTDPPFFRDASSNRLQVERPARDGRQRRRRSIPSAVRLEVMSRDGARCYLCDSTVLMDGLHFDHIIPVSRGGSNDASNLGVTCAACNMAKGDGLTNKRPRALT